MTQDEALQLALEALEYIRNVETDVISQKKYGNAEEVIRKLLHHSAFFGFDVVIDESMPTDTIRLVTPK